MASANDNNQEPSDLEELLDQMEQAEPDGNQVTLNAILDEIGHRSFGPMILLAGLITLAPIIGDIPGVPTIMGTFVILTAGQLLFHHDHIWLPDWLLRRSVRHDRMCKVLGWLRRPARFIDRGIYPRLEWFTRGVGLHVVAIVCIIIAAAMPAMEVVPFSANGAGAALTAFGLSLIAQDGLLAAIALAITVGTLGIVIYTLV